MSCEPAPLLPCFTIQSSSPPRTQTSSLQKGAPSMEQAENERQRAANINQDPWLTEQHFYRRPAFVNFVPAKLGNEEERGQSANLVHPGDQEQDESPESSSIFYHNLVRGQVFQPKVEEVDGLGNRSISRGAGRLRASKRRKPEGARRTEPASSSTWKGQGRGTREDAIVLEGEDEEDLIEITEPIKQDMDLRGERRATNVLNKGKAKAKEVEMIDLTRDDEQDDVGSSNSPKDHSSTSVPSTSASRPTLPQPSDPFPFPHPPPPLQCSICSQNFPDLASASSHFRSLAHILRKKPPDPSNPVQVPTQYKLSREGIGWKMLERWGWREEGVLGRGAGYRGGEDDGGRFRDRNEGSRLGPQQSIKNEDQSDLAAELAEDMVEGAGGSLAPIKDENEEGFESRPRRAGLGFRPPSERHEDEATLSQWGGNGSSYQLKTPIRAVIKSDRSGIGSSNHQTKRYVDQLSASSYLNEVARKKRIRKGRGKQAEKERKEKAERDKWKGVPFGKGRNRRQREREREGKWREGMLAYMNMD